MIVLALLLLAVALLLLWQAARRRAETGLPAGRVVYTDTRAWGQVEKPLYDPATGLTGKPDYLVQQGGVTLPVEVKSGYAPAAPREGHVLQLAAYCLLVEAATGARPPYGLLRYRNRTFAIDYTLALEAELKDTLAEMRRDDRRADVPRSHDDPARCAKCGFAGICDEKIV